MSDRISTNSVALRNVADLIKNYNRSQLDIIESFRNSIQSIGDSWDDDSFQSMLGNVKTLCSALETLIHETEYFPKFLENKATVLENNPKM